VKPSVRPSTYRRSEQAVGLHLVPELGRIRLANVSPQDVPRNVAGLARPPRSTHKTIRPFTPEGARQFLKAIEGDRLEALFVLALSSGLRQAESGDSNPRYATSVVFTLREA
jgi:hypothetical protein